ncbi:class I SAM-dependent methyltransferase [[Pseudopropionibacterium] massiliense]|uniref:class I SAM-dependent methyltransferase n=1 Tax=[Pseudopropionibacterium] massiliense TaxID=2220000 RepID=UPI00103171C1|nr:class I SAM-dependent methyltransferase [[Pseudopropionibacterium] massiliense]
MDVYWNHNTAYHPWITRIARARGHRDVLDVGCGDGLLLRRLAPVARSLTGIDPDAGSLTRAGQRLAGVGRTTNVTLRQGIFPDLHVDRDFDLIVFVASLHHMDLRDSLAGAARLLRPGGDLLVVGLSATRTATDWAWLALTWPFAWCASAWHEETRDVGVVTRDPREDLGTIRKVARRVLPGVRIRRGLYYRYLLRWTRSRGIAGAQE